VIALGCAGPTAVHGALFSTEIAAGDTVVVQGCGPVGLACAMLATLRGAASVTVIGGPAERLALAEQIGAGDRYLSIDELDADGRVGAVLAATRAGQGADVVLECTGVPASVPEGLAMVRKGGRYLVLGQYTDVGEVPINPHLITRKEIQITGAWGLTEQHYLAYLELIPALKERFDLSRLSRAFPLADVNQAIEAVRAGQVMKAVLDAR
jgi:threonine dehydrogenase-like Zn-dependent dehydrogenase